MLGDCWGFAEATGNVAGKVVTNTAVAAAAVACWSRSRLLVFGIYRFLYDTDWRYVPVGRLHARNLRCLSARLIEPLCCGWDALAVFNAIARWSLGSPCSVINAGKYGQAFNAVLSTGIFRRRLPVAAKIALATAGTMADVPHSPIPPGGSEL